MTGESLAGRKRPGESIIRGFLIFAAGISVLTTIGIVITLGKESFPCGDNVVWQVSSVADHRRRGRTNKNYS